MALCLSVSVCSSVSVTGRSSIERDEQIELGFFARKLSSPILRCVKRKFAYLQKWRHFPLELCPDFENFAPAYRASKRVMELARRRWTLRAWQTVVGQLSWYYLPAATLDRCIVYHRWSWSSVYSATISHGSISNSRYLFILLHYILTFPTRVRLTYREQMCA